MGRAEEHLSGCFPRPGEPIEERHLEAALDYVAHVMLTQGEVYAPVYDRIEAELEMMRKRRSPVDRARLRLAAQTLDGGLKAIR